MKKVTFIIILISFFLFICGTVFGKDKVIKVNKIIFKGLNNLSKYEILNKTKMKAIDQGIYINLDSLKEVLEREKYIQEFEINNKNDELLISIIEKKPFVLFGVYKNKKIYTIEMNKDFSIIDFNNFHMKDFPIIIISEKDYNNGKLNNELKFLSRLLNYFQKKDKNFIHQLGEIYYTKGLLRVLLKKRRTNFFLKPVYNDFIRLKYSVGHLDKSGNYPEKLVIANRMVYR